MDIELDPRHRILPFKVRAASKEAQPHKAVHVLDPDPKSHWSTSTNAKEWLLLELEEPCLLQQVRIHNKSVLEWEISLGLRYKPDLFSKIRTRCEAPRRESQYMANHAPCRYVRLSCLRGNPIAIYSVQLIGISMPGLEPEFQPLVDHLLPHVTSNKQEIQDLYLQLLGEIMTRLSPFITYLEGDLVTYNENMESTLRFLAMLSGPFYPILLVIDERERMKNLAIASDIDPSSKGAQMSLFTVSSNFQAPPRRSRSPAPSQQSGGQLIAFRPDVVLLLLKIAYKDNVLGTVCRMVARVFHRISMGISSIGGNGVLNDVMPGSLGQIGFGTEAMVTNGELPASSFPQTEYSSIFGEEFRVQEDGGGHSGLSAILDIASIEEGLLHFLYASISKPVLCQRLADVNADLVPVLPFIQAILPALRPASVGNLDQPDESFTPWQAPLVQRAFSQVVSLATTSSYRPLLDACAGYLSSFSLAHEKAACLIIDLCSGPLAPWLPIVVAKVDLAFELVEGILGFIQVVDKGTAFARAALVYVILGLSGHIDNSLAMYKAVKHNLIFVIEVLEPFLLPAITPIKNTIAFGDVSAVLTEKQEQACLLALDVLRAAMKKPAVLPALEIEWRKGNVKPSVLLSVLAPQLPIPAGIDAQKGVRQRAEENSPLVPTQNVVDGCSTKVVCDKLSKNLVTAEEVASKPEPFLPDHLDDPNFLFIPAELRFLNWKMFSSPSQDTQDFGQFAIKGDSKAPVRDSKDFGLPEILSAEYSNWESLDLQADYVQLVNFQERELRAAEFIRFASELHSQEDGVCPNSQAAIDCLLLAAECHLNPLILHSVEYEQLSNRPTTDSSIKQKLNSSKRSPEDLGMRGLFNLEEERDKVVLQILLKAAEWDAQGMGNTYEGLEHSEDYILVEDNSMTVDAENSLIDATTLVRKHQTLFCRFLIMQLQRERDNIYEALLQGLLFFLSAATELSCSPEHVVDIILRTARQLNVCLLTKIKQKHCNKTSIISMYRQWSLLCRLVAAASGGESVDGDDEFEPLHFVCHKELVPPSAWMSRIAEFASASFPLVRFIGWKGLARFAKLQQQTGVVLASDLQQLSSLLSVFADDLMSSGITKDHEIVEHFSKSLEDPLNGLSCSYVDQHSSGNAVHWLYPEVDLVCPSLKKQFSANAHVMLDAVCFQLKGIPATAIPDILSWFSELCSHPYALEDKSDSKSCTKIKGYAAANVRFIILRLLEVILVEHMEAMVPELPRVFSVVLSICQSSYCDIFLLDAVFKALKPILSFGITSAASAELQADDDSCTSTIESLCFGPLMELLGKGPDSIIEQVYDGSFIIFVSGAVLTDLSVARKLEVMHLLRNWANFSTFSETTSYYNYLCAFQKVFEACQWLLERTLNQQGFSLANVAISSKESNMLATENSHIMGRDGDMIIHSNPRDGEELHGEEILLENTQQQVITPTTDESYGSQPQNVDTLLRLGSSKVLEFEKCLESLVFALGDSLERVWKFHPQLAERLTKIMSYCITASSYLTKNSCHLSTQTDLQNICEGSESVLERRRQALVFYGSALDMVTQAISTFQRSHCWQVSACTMEFVLSQPESLEFLEVIPSLCSVVEYQCTHSPRVSWRQRSVKWLSKVIGRLIPHGSSVLISPLTQLFKVLIEHKEPEQRAGALQELERLADLEEVGRGSLAAFSSSDALSKQQIPWSSRGKLFNTDFVSAIVDAQWDSVCSLAACDPCVKIRRQAISLLVKFVPFAHPHHLQRLLSSVDTFLPGLAKDTYTMIDAPVTRLSLSLLSRACLYSTTKEISMIPSSVWSSLQVLSKPRHGNILAEAERAMCVTLLQLREHQDDAKQLIQDALSRQTDCQPQPNSRFAAVQESVLQVLARINAVRMLEDNSFAEDTQEAKDLEEAEIELELIQVEKAPGGKSKHEISQKQTPFSAHVSPPAIIQKSRKERLEHLRAQILSDERSTAREEILARRERQSLARHKRQLALEGCTLREMELLQELDREKAAEMERDIERQRILEKERAKTKELRHNLELEAERRTQVFFSALASMG